MIPSMSAATERVVAFLAGADLDVETDLSKLDGDEPALVVWPLELRQEQELRTVQRLPSRYRARYLILAGGPPDVAGAMLDRVLAAAVESTDPRLVVERLDPQLWLALGVRPRPAVLLETPVQIARESVRAPLVREPLRIEEVASCPLAGRVVDPAERPVPHVRVELASTGTTTYTDLRGVFRFGSVPAGAPIRLTVRKGETVLGISSEQTAGELVATGESLNVRADFASDKAEEA